MKFTKQQIRQIIREELHKELQQEGFLDTIKGVFKKKPPQPGVTGPDVVPPVKDATGEPAQKSAAAQPAAQATPAQPAAQATPAQPAAENAKLMKRMELFKQNMPQYFQAIQNKLASMIKGVVGQNIQPVKEAIDPVAAISSLIGKEINNTLGAALKSVTPEEFQTAYQLVAKKNIKDPKQLSQALKSFRGLEEQETVATNPLAGTELDLLDAVLQIKKIGVAGLVKQAVEKAVSNPQMKRFLPPEQAAKVIQAVTSSAKTVKQLLSKNPQATAQTITKDNPAAQSVKPVPAPVQFQESYKPTYHKWQKIIKG